MIKSEFANQPGFLLDLGQSMRKYLVLLLMLLPATQLQGQVLISLIFGEALNSGKVEFGLEGGYNWSKIDGLEADKYYSTFNLGFYFDIRLRTPWYLNTGVLVRAKLGTDHLSANDLAFLNADIYDEAGDYSQVTSTFIVPILLKYRFAENIFLAAGPGFGLSYNAWIEYNSTVEGKDATIKEYNREAVNRLDAGLMAAIGYKFPHQNDRGVSVALKFYYGLTDVYKNKNATPYRALFLTLTVPIGAQEETEDKNK